MNIFKTIYARSYQQTLRLASYFMPFKEPKIIDGSKDLSKLIDVIHEFKCKKPLIVTDESIYKLGLLNRLIALLEENKIEYSIYHGVVANPTIDNVEEGLKILNENSCDFIIALGGGSSLDCAKVIAARKSNPKKPVNKMKGLLKVGHKPLKLIAIPTTAGTGSEATVAAVIVDKKNNDKYAINDPKLIPPVAVLDPTLLVGLPKGVTSTTGMDALTHAVEAYIGQENTKRTKILALEATKLIFENLENSVNDPHNLTYRSNMQLASYKAGVAFTRAYVGTVHALAHALGGKYNVAHGLANALLLPIVLKAYGKNAYKKLAKLADYVGVNKNYTKEEKANWFISQIEKMNNDMGITNNMKDIIKIDDIPELVNHAYKEGFPLYPTPKLLTKKELTDIYLELIK